MVTKITRAFGLYHLVLGVGFRVRCSFTVIEQEFHNDNYRMGAFWNAVSDRYYTDVFM